MEASTDMYSNISMDVISSIVALREKTACLGGDCTGRPRTAVIVEDGSFKATNSVTIRAFTSHPTEAPSSALPSSLPKTTDSSPGACSWWTGSTARPLANRRQPI
ncbi:MAG: hypothetical protein MJB57_09880, partial [Gemmatimonadetes bacterium]|nr:hypothetical protein [Gemmatimonadota bacterium]